ncbi:MAG: hypothetical protein KDK27_15875 [Leptospiraceae bacterium]|nr:hypothetical protein [Leptospiraceae bacterium]
MKQLNLKKQTSLADVRADSAADSRREIWMARARRFSLVLAVGMWMIIAIALPVLIFAEIVQPTGLFWALVAVAMITPFILSGVVEATLRRILESLFPLQKQRARYLSQLRNSRSLPS